MAKKVKAAPAHGLIVVRNVDLEVWKQLKQVAEDRRPKVKLGSLLSEIVREWIERDSRTKR